MEAELESGSAAQTARGPTFSAPVVSLPKGGGAIRGIDEKFQANPATGTASLSIPIATSPGRSGFGPELRLAYDSGSGNGPFGFGWSLGLPTVTRKTDKGLPQYRDEEESDVFVLSGAEDLCPLLDGTGERICRRRQVNGADYEICPYRPRIDSLYARIERWTATATGETHWRTISRDNVTTLYGLDETSRVADPADPARAFSYLIARTFDDKGNLIVYEYAPEDGRSVEDFLAHEANRGDNDRGAQRYPKTIRYGGFTPYFPEWDAKKPPADLPAHWHFAVVFDYGDHSADAPMPAPDGTWKVRVDPFSSYRPGFEVRTYRRCERVLMFHNFPTAAEVGSDCLVRSTDLTYSDELNAADPQNPSYTLLASARHTAHRRRGHGYRQSSMPAVELEYSKPEVVPDVLTFDRESLEDLPEGVDGSGYQWVDLDGEGLSGLLTTTDAGWGYKPNLSPTNQVRRLDGSFATHAKFGPLETVATLPSAHELDARHQFLDLSGDGCLDLVAFDERAAGFFERGERRDWSTFRPFASLPRIDWTSPQHRFCDVTGDGLADILVTEDHAFSFHRSLGEAGFDPAEYRPAPTDEEQGPTVTFGEYPQTVFMADMSGDGLADLVRIRNGEVCYWPNLGYGRYGRKVTMDGCPRFGDQSSFDPARIRLADIDGSGTSDLVYVGADSVQVCFNCSGNSWAQPHTLGTFPTADDDSAVRVTDLLGTGTACLVWSSSLPAESTEPIRYIDLMGGKKPHLLVAARNNLGAETRVRYAPSTRFYLADERAGRPWRTRLPFPTHVVERVETYDWIGRSRYITRYAYHDGHFDGSEREFRGFGFVEQWDTEEHRNDTDFPDSDAVNWDTACWVPPMRRCTWFHTGALPDAEGNVLTSEHWIEPALRASGRDADRDAMRLPPSVLPDGLTAEETQEAFRALKGRVLREEIYADERATKDSPSAPSERSEFPYSVSEHTYAVRTIQRAGPNPHAAFDVQRRETLTFDYERSPDDPRVTHELTLQLDLYGNLERNVSVGYPRRRGYRKPEPDLSERFQTMLAHDQDRLHVTATEHRQTKPVDDAKRAPDAYRAPMPAETLTAELSGFEPRRKRAGTTNLFRFDELAQWMTELWHGAGDVPYEQIPASDVDGSGSPAAKPTRRIVERARTLYRRDDLTALLPFGDLEPGALPGESYHLALTPGLVAGVFGNHVDDATLTEAGYVKTSDGWWIPSGRLFYSSGDGDAAKDELDEARRHFWRSRRVVDPFGGVTRTGYDDFDLLPTSVIDAVRNTTSAENDYRVLQPVAVTDPNLNRAEVAFDTLGFVVGSAVMGKKGDMADDLAGFEADLDPSVVAAHLADPLHDPAAIIASASSRTVYDLSAYERTRRAATPDPPVVYTINREIHAAELGTAKKAKEARYQHSFVYSDGLGREVQRKAQAEAGPLKKGGL